MNTTSIKLPNAIELVETGQLIPYARNSRIHSPDQVQALARSILQFGFTNPIAIDQQGQIIAGHGRVMAAHHLGMAQVPCIRLDHLTDAQRRAYVIADNRLAELSEWDTGLLARELHDAMQSGLEADLLGFDDEYLTNLLDEPLSTNTPPPPDGDDPEQRQPTADDYADIGKGTLHDHRTAPITYPIMIQLDKPTYSRWKAARAKLKNEQLITELLDIADRYRADWQAEKAFAEQQV